MGKYLELKNISKTFPGVKALNNVNMIISEGEVHALVGENGSGKSTLIKIISGIEKPDEGSFIEIEGEKIYSLNAAEAIRKGIATIYQDFSLFDNLTVSENISITQIPEKRINFINWKKLKKMGKMLLKN